jgi:hypothetical protein
MKAYKGVEIQLPSFVTLAPDGGKLPLQGVEVSGNL